MSLFNVPAVGVFGCGFASSTDDSGNIAGIFHVHAEFYIRVRSNFIVCRQYRAICWRWWDYAVLSVLVLLWAVLCIIVWCYFSLWLRPVSWSFVSWAARVINILGCYIGGWISCEVGFSIWSGSLVWLKGNSIVQKTGFIGCILHQWAWMWELPCFVKICWSYLFCIRPCLQRRIWLHLLRWYCVQGLIWFFHHSCLQWSLIVQCGWQ